MALKTYNGFSGAYREKQGRKVYAAFKRGDLPKPSLCVGCGATPERGYHLMAHNEDYHRPFGFVEICFSCHMAVHRRFKELDIWYRYRDLAANGWEPPRGRDYEKWVSTWYSLKRAQIPELKNTSWLHTLPDVEPDLYTEDAAEGLFDGQWSEV